MAVHAGPRSHGGLSSLAKTERPVSARATVARLTRYLKPHRAQVAVGTLWVIASSAASAATPALTGHMVDVAIAAARSHAGHGGLIVPGLALASASIFGWLAARQQILTLGTAGQYALFDARGDIIAKIEQLDIGFFESVESGDLMSRLVNDISQVDSFLSQVLRRLLSAATGLLMTLAAMMWVSWRLALATLLVVPVMLGVTRLFGMIARRAFRARQEALGDVSTTLAEELGGIKTAQAFNRTDRNRDVFAQRNAANRDASVNAAVVASAFSPVLALVSTVATALVAGLGGYLAAQHLLTVGVVVAFLSYARQFFNVTSQLSSLYSDTQAALAGGERVFSLLDAPVHVADEPGAAVLGELEGRVEYRGVHFAYASGPEVLHGVDLVIERGETLAIVGATGAGKTTLANLLPRFYDPSQGSVLVDGIDVRTATMRSLRAHFGIVLQDPFLFAGTIAENIRYGSLDASDSSVREAANVAGALEFIEALPDGFDTQIGERGATLSTGQRQLIAFARAIVGDPAILILDEATSSVDTRTELLIQRGLRRILEGRTAVIIAHRLSTIRDAHRIVVMDSGRIAEQGDYASLLSAGGLFAALHDAQFSAR
jgi:ATP-binding cassette, subfamily B, multidrug efflux pump